MRTYPLRPAQRLIGTFLVTGSWFPEERASISASLEMVLHLDAGSEGGSRHIADCERGSLGAALSAEVRRTGGSTGSFSGDGATDEVAASVEVQSRERALR